MSDLGYEGGQFRGLDPLPPSATIGSLREAPKMPQDAWLKALFDQMAETLDDPAIRPKLIELIKKVLPGRVLDGFASMILDAVIKALRSL